MSQEIDATSGAEGQALMELSSIEVKGNKIVAHYRKEVDIVTASPKTNTKLNWLWEQGFDLLVFSWSGYGYGRKEGKWWNIDIIGRKVESPSDNPYFNDSFIISMVVPEREWGSWVKEVPIIHKKGEKL